MRNVDVHACCHSGISLQVGRNTRNTSNCPTPQISDCIPQNKGSHPIEPCWRVLHILFHPPWCAHKSYTSPLAARLLSFQVHSLSSLVSLVDIVRGVWNSLSSSAARGCNKAGESAQCDFCIRMRSCYEVWYRGHTLNTWRYTPRRISDWVLYPSPGCWSAIFSI